MASRRTPISRARCFISRPLEMGLRSNGPAPRLRAASPLPTEYRRTIFPHPAADTAHSSHRKRAQASNLRPLALGRCHFAKRTDKKGSVTTKIVSGLRGCEAGFREPVHKKIRTSGWHGLCSMFPAHRGVMSVHRSSGQHLQVHLRSGLRPFLPNRPWLLIFLLSTLGSFR